MLEQAIGGSMRAIDFIYRSSGVNRPLRSNELHPDYNLSKIVYRDQINKVANAIKEIIIAMRSDTSNADYHPQRSSHGLQARAGTFARSIPGQKTGLKKWLSFALIALLIGAGLYYFSQKREVVPIDQEKYIAVLPLTNLSDDPNNQFFADGIVEDLLNRLSTIEGFKVISRTSSERYRGRGEKSLPQIAKELGVSYIIEGSVQRDANKTRINIQLIDCPS